MFRVVALPIVLVMLLVFCGSSEGDDRVDSPKRPEAESEDLRDSKLPLNVCLVPEMGYIPELRVWKWCSADTEPAATKKLAELWPTEAARLRPIVTPGLTRRLSRWARPQMEGYRSVPSLDKVRFQPVATDRKNDGDRLNYIVFRGQVDTLPTHSPLVTRWLEVYVLYGVHGESILRTTVTIRGELLE